MSAALVASAYNGNNTTICENRQTRGTGQAYARAEIAGSNIYDSDGLAYVEADSYSPPCPFEVGYWKTKSGFTQEVSGLSETPYSHMIIYDPGETGAFVYTEAHACGRGVSATTMAYLSGYCAC